MFGGRDSRQQRQHQLDEGGGGGGRGAGTGGRAGSSSRFSPSDLGGGFSDDDASPRSGARSVNLLDDSTDSDSDRTEEPSPATQTLNCLSQASAAADLRYDMSRLSRDVALEEEERARRRRKEKKREETEEEEAKKKSPKEQEQRPPPHVTAPAAPRRQNGDPNGNSSVKNNNSGRNSNSATAANASAAAAADALLLLPATRRRRQQGQALARSSSSSPQTTPSRGRQQQQENKLSPPAANAAYAISRKNKRGRASLGGETGAASKSNNSVAASATATTCDNTPKGETRAPATAAAAAGAAAASTDKTTTKQRQRRAPPPPPQWMTTPNVGRGPAVPASDVVFNGSGNGNGNNSKKKKEATAKARKTANTTATTTTKATAPSSLTPSNPSQKNQQKQHTATAPTATAAPAPASRPWTRVDENRFDLVAVTIAHRGSLGMTIERVDDRSYLSSVLLPLQPSALQQLDQRWSALLSSPNPQQSPRPPQQACKVRLFRDEQCLAFRSGLLEEDLFVALVAAGRDGGEGGNAAVRWSGNEGAAVLDAVRRRGIKAFPTFEEVQATVKDGTRPLVMVVARDKNAKKKNSVVTPVPTTAATAAAGATIETATTATVATAAAPAPVSVARQASVATGGAADEQAPQGASIASSSKRGASLLQTTGAQTTARSGASSSIATAATGHLQEHGKRGGAERQNHRGQSDAVGAGETGETAANEKAPRQNRQNTDIANVDSSNSGGRVAFDRTGMPPPPDRGQKAGSFVSTLAIRGNEDAEARQGHNSNNNGTNSGSTAALSNIHDRANVSARAPALAAAVPPPPAATTATAVSVADRRSRPPQLLPGSSPTSIVPFCGLCNGRTDGKNSNNSQRPRRAASTVAPVHHAWCPENPLFERTGARLVLERLRWGIANGCRFCEETYKKGRWPTAKEKRVDASLKHTRACEMTHQERRKADVEKKKELAKQQQQAAAAKKTSTTSRKTKHVKRKYPLPSLSSSSDNSDDEGYAGAYGRRSQLSTSRGGKKRPATGRSDRRFREESREHNCSSSSDEEPAANQGQRTTSAGISQKRLRSTNATDKTSRSSVARRASSKRTGTRSITPIGEAVRDDGVESDFDDSDTDVAKITWVPARNPWGPEQYQEGDVVLFSDGPPFSNHVERLLPSPRFELDPFVSHRRYRNTHRTPQEGFHVLELRRDPFATLPWGFTVQRHEFGGACLVKSVEPLSAAATAVFLAAADDDDHSSVEQSRLRVNDMLIAVGGKRVGGMTVNSLDIELEISGPVLHLVVSRYKYAAQVEEGIRRAEETYFQAVDEALNDQRRLGWVDIGMGGYSTSRTASTRVGGIDTSAAAANNEMSPRAVSRGGCPGHEEQEGIGCEVTGQLSTAEASASKVGPLAQLAFANAEEHAYHEASIGNEMDVDKTYLGHSRKNDQRISDATGVTLGAFHSHESDDDVSQAPLMNDGRSDFDTYAQEEDEGHDDEDSEEGNAKMGCVCGVIHGVDIPVFWIQCESCRSWYNVASQCVGLSVDEATNVPHWTCWGCPSWEEDEDEAGDGETEGIAQQSPLPASCNETSLGNQAVESSSSQHPLGSTFAGPDPSEHLNDPAPYNENADDADCGSIHPNQPPRNEEDDDAQATTSEKHPTDPQDDCQSTYGEEPKAAKLQKKKAASKKRGGDGGPKAAGRRASEGPPSKRRAGVAEEEQENPAARESGVGGNTACRSSRQVFAKNSIVFIKEHGWPGVSNESGHAKVLKSYRDEDGDLAYDVKYIVGGRKVKCIWAQFVLPPQFNDE